MNNLYPGGMPKLPYRRPNSIADLDDYIRSNLDVRAAQKRNSDALMLAEQNSERQRQMQQDALDQSKKQGIIGNVTQLGTTAAMLAGKEGIAKGAGYLGEGAYNLLPETAQNYLASLADTGGQWGGVGASELTNTVSPVAESMAASGAETTGGFLGADAAVTPSLSEAGVLAEPAVATGTTSSLAPLVGTASETGAAPVASMAAEEAAAMNAGVGAPAGMSSAELGTGVSTAAPSTTSSLLGSVAPVVAAIAAAELARGQWGGAGIPYDEKTTQQRTVDSPGTAGVLPFLIGAKDNTTAGNFYKGMSALERTAMAPIDYIFGDKDAFNRDTLKVATNQALTPFGTEGVGGAVSHFVNPVGGLVSKLTSGDSLGDKAIDVTASVLTGGLSDIVSDWF